MAASSLEGFAASKITPQVSGASDERFGTTDEIFEYE
jgi:hypothetical protein